MATRGLAYLVFPANLADNLGSVRGRFSELPDAENRDFFPTKFFFRCARELSALCEQTEAGGQRWQTELRGQAAISSELQAITGRSGR